MEDRIAQECKRLVDAAVNRRSVWDAQFQDVVDYCRPNAGDFQGQKSPGDDRYRKIYDATAVDALEEFSSGLNAFLTNPTDRWFHLRPISPKFANDRRVKLWCEEVSNIIYHYYSSSSSGHVQAMNEGFLDIGSFGTTVVHQYWKDGLRFKTFALGDCYIDENSDNRVDTVIRRVPMTGRKLAQEFKTLPPRAAEAIQKQPNKPFTVWHLVFPKSDELFLEHVKPNKPFASIWLLQETVETLKFDGFQWFPYHVPRWVKLANEIYGRSPALKAMPDIKMLNRLEFHILKAVSKATDPPLIVPNEAFLVPLKTSPGAVNYKEPGSDKIEMLEISRGFPVSEQKAEQKREAIRKYFFNDFLRMEKENVEMTAYEVQDRREEKLRLLAPMLGRQESEFLGPMITLSYLLLARFNEIPSPPRDIVGGMKIEYTSPAARAQTGMRAFAMDRYIQRLLPAAQVNPDVFSRVNWDAYSKEMADAMGTTEKILYDDEEMAQRRQAQEQQRQQQQLVEAAEPASKAVKNLAEAGVSPQDLIQ